MSVNVLTHTFYRSRVNASLNPDIRRLPLHTSQSNQESANKYRMELMQQVGETNQKNLICCEGVNQQVLGRWA